MDSSGTASSSLSQQQHYSSLLSTVAELRSDLEKTLSRIQTLEGVNRELTENYETSQGELIEVRRKFLEAQENYQKCAISKLESDKMNSLFAEKIQQQLADKIKEFEALREKFIPQDIDYVRIKVQEELEIPHKQQLMALESEIERQKDLYYSVRRESERYKADYEFFAQSQQREVNAIRTEHEREMSVLRDQLTRLQSKDDAGERDEKLRTQLVKMQEMQKVLDILRQEKETLLREQSELKSMLEQTRSSGEQTKSQLRAQCASMEAEKLSLDTKIGNLLNDIESKNSQLISLKQNYEGAVSQLEHKTVLLSDREAFILSMKEAHNEEMDKLRRKLEEDILVRDNEIQIFTQKLHDREELVRKTFKEATELQLRAEANEGEIRRGFLTKFNEIKQKNELLEIEVATIRKEFQLALIQRNEMQDKFTKEANILRSEISRITREKGAMLTRSTLVEQALDAERRKVSSNKRLSAARAAMSNDLVAEMKNKIADLEKKLQEAREKEIKTAANLTSAEEMLSHKEKEHILSMETLHREAHSRYEQLGREYKEQLDALKTQSQRALSKERKRSEAYKEKALEAHQRGKLLSAVLAAGGSSQTLQGEE